MAGGKDDLSMSKLSIHSNGSEDWDHSELEIQPSTTTPRNSVLFPAEGGIEVTPGKVMSPKSKGSRSISELLRLHAEKGTDVKFSAEEASRVAEVLGQWINSGSSPYEGEDDFFTRSQDDSWVASKRCISSSSLANGRPRGQSEGSRPPSAAGIKS